MEIEDTDGSRREIEGCINTREMDRRIVVNTTYCFEMGNAERESKTKVKTTRAPAPKRNSLGLRSMSLGIFHHYLCSGKVQHIGGSTEADCCGSLGKFMGWDEPGLGCPELGIIIIGVVIGRRCPVFPQESCTDGAAGRD